MIALGLLAAVVLLLALLDVARQRQRRQVVEWLAAEWQQRAEAVCRVADDRLDTICSLRKSLAEQIDREARQVLSSTTGMIVH